MRVLVGGVEINLRIVLVGLVRLDERFVLVQRKVFTLNIFQQDKTLCALVEFLVGQNSVLDEKFQIVPLALELRAVGFEDFLQTVGHFFGDVARNLLHVRIGLQIATRHVQRDVGRVDDAVQKCQKFRHNALDTVGHKHLIAVELDFVLLNLDVVLDFRKVQNTS